MTDATTSQALAAANDHHEVMTKAFDLVDPTAATGDWRGPIRMRGERRTIERCCELLGFTFDQVLESIEYFTATQPRVTEEDGLLTIEADGYRAGPAGDH